jgi:glutamate-ammonia-ligase adenylyltransferase
MKPINTFPENLISDADIKWSRFCTAAEKLGVSLPVDPEFIQIAKCIFCFSNFVANSCILNPELLVGLIESGDLNRRHRRQTYRQMFQDALVGIKEEVGLEQVLRRLRRREMVRIAWRDIAGWADLSETMADLTALADDCIDQTLSLLYNWQCATHGIPIGTDGSPQKLVVIGLGKLGGRELNFSSDVDLIFAFPEIGNTKGGLESTTNEDFFVRLCRRLIKILGSVTVDG